MVASLLHRRDFCGYATDDTPGLEDTLKTLLTYSPYECIIDGLPRKGRMSKTLGIPGVSELGSFDPRLPLTLEALADERWDLELGCWLSSF